MIISGQLLLVDGPERTPGRATLEPGHLRVEDGRVVEVVPGELVRRCDLGGENCLICPGFVDAHLHLPQFGIIGAHGMPLLEWLAKVVFPAEQRWADADYARSATDRVINQCYAHGTTAICGFASVHGPATKAALEVAARRKMRGVIGQVLMDREAPHELLHPTDQQLDETFELLQNYRTGSRLAAAVTPRFAVACSEELLAAAGTVASETGAVIQTHLAETPGECARVAELFGGSSYVDVYRDAGLLTERTLCGHGIYLSVSERQTLADLGTAIIHCPTANSFLRAGSMDRAAHLRNGVRLGLGSDIGAGYERSMVRVARAMVETASSLGEDYPDAAQAWWQITYGNADVAFRNNTDILAPGCSADLLVIEPDLPWLASSADPLAMLLFAWNDHWLKQTVVAGEVVYRG